MAKCKLCKTDIPDGTEYCQNCQEKRSKDKANESYLDSLLNSVKNTSEPSEVVIRKRKTEDKNSNPAEKVKKASENKKTPKLPQTGKSMRSIDSDLDDDDLYRVDFSDVEDFNKYNFEADLQDIDNDIVISEEDLFGDGLSNLLNDQSIETAPYNYKAELENVVKDTIIHHTMPESQSELADQSVAEAEERSAEIAMNSMTGFETQEESMAELETGAGLETDFKPEWEQQAKVEDPKEAKTEASHEEDTYEASDETTGPVNKEIVEHDIPQEVEELPEDSGLDFDLDELLNSLDNSGDMPVQNEQKEIHTDAARTQNEVNAEPYLEDMFHTFSEEDTIEELDLTAGTPDFEPVEAEDEDFMKLLSQISGDDPVSGDLKALSDLMSSPQSEIKPMNMPSDVGEVFSDALTAVSSLKDYDPEDEDFFNLESDHNEGAPKGGNGKQTKKKSAKKADKKGKKVKSEGNLFQRLFGNVKNEKTAAQFAVETKQRETEEYGAPGDKPKKEKGKKKGKKGAEAAITDETSGGGKKPGRDSEDDTAPVDKKAEKKKAKEEKKKAKESKAAIEIIDEIDEDPGRINRLGATIVFIFFGALAAILILGSNIISYTLNIQHAADYFSKQKYTEAYYEVYGVELKDEDLELYEKIATVMFVNKQLNSYNNYYNIKQYPQALDSLLKGLKRYDKYIELATYLGVDSDLNYVREQILAELNKKYNLTENEAVKINSIANMKDYSLAVYDVVLEKMNK